MTRTAVRGAVAVVALFAAGYLAHKLVSSGSSAKGCCGGGCCDERPTKTQRKARVNAAKNRAPAAAPVTSAKPARRNLVPGTADVYVHTYGCAHNASDGEYMQGILVKFGYSLVDTWEAADVVILNSCTVKNPSQEAAMTLAERAKLAGKAVIIGGCVPQADRNVKGWEDLSMVGVTQIDRIVEVVEETLAGNTVKLLQKSELPSLDLPKIRKNPLVESESRRGL